MSHPTDSKERLHTASRKLKQHSDCRKQYRGISKIVKKLPCNPGTLLKGIYSMELKAACYKDACTSVFVSAHFTIFRKRN